MSDASWIKIKSALPRPTSEEHTRPLRLFAPGYTTGEDTPAESTLFWEAARERFGDEPIDGEIE